MGRVQTILIVEDEAHVAGMLREAVEAGGMDCVTASSDQAAFILLQQLEPAVLVADINLGPGQTGYGVARHARALYPRLPVVFMSGEASALSWAGFGVADARHLEKPFGGEALLAMLHELLA